MMFLAAHIVSATDAVQPLTVNGKHLITPTGEVVTLRGVNVGNWLLLEPWMLGLPQEDTADGFSDQATILEVLDQRFGQARADELMEIYREHWLTPRDFQIIRSFGFNVVRLPFHYSLLEDPDNPGELREDAFKWIDRGIAMAQDAGLYTILDLHGVPGGQSVDAPTGKVEQNKLWDSREYQDRTVALWIALAERYGDHPAVAAYDVVNEPFGDFKVNISPVMKDLFGRLHDAIRTVDPDTLIYAPGTLQGIAFYGDPAGQGWTNVGFTEHTYPGLFGYGEPSLATHARFLSQWVGGKSRTIDAMDVPYLVGEFNVVFDHVGGPDLMRVYFDTYNAQGWAATMWSYKITKASPGIEDSNWYMVTNDESFDMSDLRTVDDKTLEDRFRSLAEMPLAIDDELRGAMTQPQPTKVALPFRVAVFEAEDQPLDGWTAVDIGDASPGGFEVLADGRWSVWGGGNDVFNDHDDFRLIYQSSSENEALWTRLDALDATDRYAKAGVMLRESTAPNAAHVLLHGLPDGRVVFATRPESGELTQEKTLAISGFPMGLAIERDAEGLTLHYTNADAEWQSTRVASPSFDTNLSGLAVLAHDEAALTQAIFTAPSNMPPPVTFAANAAETNLLLNASFETVEDPTHAADRAQHWNRWGQWFNRQNDWTPVRSGNSILAYHHWQIETGDSSGVWQDVEGLTPGQTYEFQAFGNLDRGSAGKSIPSAVELKLEAPQPDGSVLTLATRTYPAKDLATADGWSRLSVTGQAVSETMRVLLIVYPADNAARDGAIKLDDVSLQPIGPSEPE
ncbi:MAG: cellulase family glycosylhydrolase [Planctomycetota bacterium]